MKSIVYIIIYFLKGCLPWQGLKLNNKEEKYKKVCEIKNEITPANLSKDLPEEFEAFVEYVKKLEFTEVPNYNYLKGLLKTIIKKSGFVIDYYYDWCTTKPNIKHDDPIYTNNYNIEYNGHVEWLSNLNSKTNDLEHNENNEEYKSINKGSSSVINNSHGLHNGHNRAESNNLSTKCVDSESKKNLPFTSSKKIK